MHVIDVSSGALDGAERLLRMVHSSAVTTLLSAHLGAEAEDSAVCGLLLFSGSHDRSFFAFTLPLFFCPSLFPFFLSRFYSVLVSFVLSL